MLFLGLTRCGGTAGRPWGGTSGARPSGLTDAPSTVSEQPLLGRDALGAPTLGIGPSLPTIGPQLLGLEPPVVDVDPTLLDLEPPVMNVGPTLLGLEPPVLATGPLLLDLDPPVVDV